MNIKNCSTQVPNKHIRIKSGSAKTFFRLKSGLCQSTVPPPMAFGEAVLFLNHCGCTGWSAPLFFHGVVHMFYEH